MVVEEFSILWHQKFQTIGELKKVILPENFRGRPVLNPTTPAVDIQQLINLCPTKAIAAEPFQLNLGKCVFCNECALQYPEAIRFTYDFRIATNNLESLIIKAGDNEGIRIDENLIQPQIRNFFNRTLKLRQVSAGGDNSNEMELNAAGNVNFDMGRFGIEFTASPRHADGIVITGPITQNMARALEICYDAVPNPKLIVLVGSEAISGGVFAQAPAIDRTFISKYKPDLYVPGQPAHPLTFVCGLLDLLGRKYK